MADTTKGAVECALSRVRVNMPGLVGSGHWTCATCAYAGDHDANPGCQRERSPLATLAAENAALVADAKRWAPIHEEIHRRADKEWCLQERTDFEVWVTYEQYAALTRAAEDAK